MKKSAASQAVLALRTRLGQSQQRFAEQTLKSSIMTVSRYEGKFPPRGEALLGLAEVADKGALVGLRDTFRQLYLDEINQKLTFAAIVLPKPVGSAVYQALRNVGVEDLAGMCRFPLHLLEKA